MSEPAKAGLPRPDAAQLLAGVLALGREDLAADPRALAERFHRALTDLFPGRAFTVRLYDANGGELALPRGGRAGLAALSIPLVAGGAALGALEVRYPDGHQPSQDDAALLSPIAEHLAMIAANSRRHAETALLKDYLTKLIDHADALIIGVDPEWRVTVFNRALVRLSGYSVEEVVGTDVRRWIPEAARAHVVGAFAHALAGRPAASLDVELTTKGGKIVRTVWNVAAIGQVPGGRAVEAVVAIGQDVTRLKSLERQVIQAEKLATLGQLAAGVVHELNNPLTSIIVYADYLQKKLDPGSGDAEKLRRILEGAERILNFSRNLVQYAKPSSEQLDVVSLNDVCRQALSFCEHLVKRGGVELVVDMAEELSPLYAVRGQLQQVVINLITNAVHALPAEGGRVTVATRQIDGAHVALLVEDTGPGVPPEDRTRIFEPFFTTKPAGKGTGLGLSIVRNIVESHRGLIEVDSPEQRGARFTIVLPTGH